MYDPVDKVLEQPDLLSAIVAQACEPMFLSVDLQ